MGKRAWIEIDFSAILDNIDIIRRHTGKKFMACVKADCYGMGMCRIAKSIEQKADFFGVAETSEAISLRESGIKKPILVMGSILPEDVEILADNDIRITLCNEEVLEKIARVVATRDKKINVHIKIDTGLGRIGVMPSHALDFIERASKIKGLNIEGIFTHLATADWDDKSYAIKQIECFGSILQQTALLKIPLKHIANSAAIINFPETYKNFDMVRIGLLLLGVYPDKKFYKNLPLKAALNGYCRVFYVKDVPKGTCLSYGITFKTKREVTKVATVGLGYGDGLKRFLSNKYYLQFQGKKMDILGNICMDQTLVDATGMDIKIGDTVKVFADNFEIEDMAVIGNTVSQEILCGFGSVRMKKHYL